MKMAELLPLEMCLFTLISYFNITYHQDDDDTVMSFTATREWYIYSHNTRTMESEIGFRKEHFFSNIRIKSK